MTIQPGETIPSGSLSSVPYDPELDTLDVCVPPQPYSTDQWKGKKVLVVSIPGAFTGTCHQQHIPPYVAKYEEFKSKGIDIIAVVAANDAWVMNAWGKTLGFKDKIVGVSDPDAVWSRKLGYGVDLTSKGMGHRTGRWYMILDDLKVVATDVEPNPGAVQTTSADIALSRL